MSKKRSSTSSVESLAMQTQSDTTPKKPRTDGNTNITFASLTEEDPVELKLPTAEDVEFNFGELAHEFVSTPVPGNYDYLFGDLPMNIVPVNEVSDVSDEEKSSAGANNSKQEDGLTGGNAEAEPVAPAVPQHEQAPMQTGCVTRGTGECPSTTNTTNTNTAPSEEANSGSANEESNLKRQADRAARNRESSRRAREKAKSRLRSLEADNMALRDMVRRFKMQNDHLLTQLDRASVMQQSCTMCRYNAAMAQQQPACTGGQSQVLPVRQ